MWPKMRSSHALAPNTCSERGAKSSLKVFLCLPSVASGHSGLGRMSGAEGGGVDFVLNTHKSKSSVSDKEGEKNP